MLETEGKIGHSACGLCLLLQTAPGEATDDELKEWMSPSVSPAVDLVYTNTINCLKALQYPQKSKFRNRGKGKLSLHFINA